MATFRNRFQNRGDVLAIFAAASLPIFAWAIALLVIYASQYILRLSLWDTLGVASYVLSYALLESLIVFAIAMLILLLLPARWHGRLTIPITAAALFLTTVFVVYMNVTQEKTMVRGRFTEPLIALAVYLLLLVVTAFVIRRSPRLVKLINAVLDRVVPLAVLYGFLGVVGAVIVLARNLMG